MTDYKNMFEQAVRTLAAIDEALGIGDDGCGDPDQTLTAIADLKASPISEEAMDILRSENDKLKTEVEEFAVLVSRLALKLKKVAPDDDLYSKATDYLKRTGRAGSPLRKVGAGETAVTREMITAAHGVTLKTGDVVLSARLLEAVYLAMDQAAPPAQTPFDTCPPKEFPPVWTTALDIERERLAQICDGFDAVNPHIGQAAEVAKLLRSNGGSEGRAADRRSVPLD